MPLFALVLTAVDSSCQNVPTCNLALGQETVGLLIDLHVGLAELRNVRDRVEAT